MGGAAVVVTNGDPKDPQKVHTIERKGALFTCSYEEEVEAMREAALWIAENCDHQTEVMICMDSQSLCMGITTLNPETDTIRETP